MLHRILKPVYFFQPLMSRAEVFKVGVTHYFKPDNSRKLLNYYPIVSPEEGQRRMCEYWRKKTENRRKSVFHQLIVNWIFILISFVVILVGYGFATK